MATLKPKRKKQVKVVKTDKTLPKYGFVNLFFIDARAKRIVQGKVESINTIHKPRLDGEKRVVEVVQDHYYSLRTEVYTEHTCVHEDNVFLTHESAAKKLGATVTDYLK